jgi:O-antigen/teichoic acid export membrane protein
MASSDTPSSAGAERHGHNLGWLLAGDLFGKAVSVVFFAYLSRKLTVAENGHYGTFIAYLPILLGVIAIGLPDIVTREVARRHERLDELIGPGMALQSTLFLFVTPLAWGLSHVLGYSPALQLIVFLAAVGAFLRALIGMHTAALNGYEQFKLISLIAIATRTLTACGACLALYTGLGLAELLLFFLGAYVVELILSFLALRHASGGYRVHASARAAGLLVREGTGMALSRFASILFYMADVPLLNVLATPEAVGLYAIGSRFLVLLWTFADQLENVSYPILSRKAIDTEAAQGRAVTRLIRVMAFGAVPMAVGMALLARPLVVLLCGARYLDGAFPTIMLTGVLACEMLARIPVVYLRASARPHWVTACYLAGAVAKLTLGPLLIMKWGTAPFLVAGLVLAALTAVALLEAARRAIGTFSWADLLRILGGPVIASAVMAVPVWLVRDWPIAVSVPGGALVYAAALWGLGVLDAEDKQLIRGLLRMRAGDEDLSTADDADARR